MLQTFAHNNGTAASRAMCFVVMLSYLDLVASYYHKGNYFMPLSCTMMKIYSPLAIVRWKQQLPRTTNGAAINYGERRATLLTGSIIHLRQTLFGSIRRWSSGISSACDESMFLEPDF